jgi:hypothetical protein
MPPEVHSLHCDPTPGTITDYWNIRRRVKKVCVSADAVAALFRRVHHVTRGVPADAVLVRVTPLSDPMFRFAGERDCFMMVFQHPSFPVVPECDDIPDADVRFGFRTTEAAP